MKVEILKQHMTDSHLSITEKLDKILEQTIKTNGRVSALEKWRSYTVGAVSIITILVIPVLLMFLKSHL